MTRIVPPFQAHDRINIFFEAGVYTGECNPRIGPYILLIKVFFGNVVANTEVTISGDQWPSVPLLNIIGQYSAENWDQVTSTQTIIDCESKYQSFMIRNWTPFSINGK